MYTYMYIYREAIKPVHLGAHEHEEAHSPLFLHAPFPEHDGHAGQLGSSQFGPFLPSAHDGGKPHSSSSQVHLQSTQRGEVPGSHSGHVSSGQMQPSGPIVDCWQFMHSHSQGQCPAESSCCMLPSSHSHSHGHVPSSPISFSSSSPGHVHGHSGSSQRRLAEPSGQKSHRHSPLGCREMHVITTISKVSVLLPPSRLWSHRHSCTDTNRCLRKCRASQERAVRRRSDTSSTPPGCPRTS